MKKSIEFGSDQYFVYMISNHFNFINLSLIKNEIKVKFFQ